MSREACWVFVGSEIFYDHRLQICVGVAALRGLRSYFTGWTKFYCGQSFRGQLFISPPLIRIPIPRHKKPVVKGKAREEGIFWGTGKRVQLLPPPKIFHSQKPERGVEKFSFCCRISNFSAPKIQTDGELPFLVSLRINPYEMLKSCIWSLEFERRSA